MRTWVEKLAKRIKRGKYEDGLIVFDNVSIAINNCNHFLYVNSSDRSVSIKLYDDEYDLIRTVQREAKAICEKYFIDLFESFTDEVTSESENDID